MFLFSEGSWWSERNVELIPQFEVQNVDRFRYLPHSKNFFPSVTIVQNHFAAMPMRVKKHSCPRPRQKARGQSLTERIPKPLLGSLFQIFNSRKE